MVIEPFFIGERMEENVRGGRDRSLGRDKKF
jgi:hypothetical protein